MSIQGWDGKYSEIVNEFKYSKQLDHEAAVILDSIMRRTVTNTRMSDLISGRTVFVIGAGSSLRSHVSKLKQSKNIKIVADSAVKLMTDAGVVPDIVVTDLDGDESALKKCGRGRTVFVVHAHGDNIPRLYLARNFINYMGTTQARPYGCMQNFGGFTDGDRAVFLASHFGARRIVLFGMDYNGRISRFSNTKKSDRELKLRKLKKSKDLLEWLSERTRTELFTISNPICGFKKIRPSELDLFLE